MARAFSPSTLEVKADGSLNSSPAWSTKQVSGQTGLLHKKKKRVDNKFFMSGKRVKDLGMSYILHMLCTLILNYLSL